MNDLFSTCSIINSIQEVAGSCSPDHPIALHEPDFTGTEAWTYVKDCLDTGWVSTAGNWVTRFEQELSSVTGAPHVVAVTNGTVALRLALHLVGVCQGDEVLLPPLSFVATANAVSHLGAVPHFVDVGRTTLGMDPVSLAARLDQVAERRNGQLVNRQTGRRLAAVLPVHVFGHPAEVAALRKVADAWQLPLIEDAAEALGSWSDDTHCGLFGDIGTLSFNGNKLITTGGGGALLINDELLAEKARHLSTTAKLPHPWQFDHDSVAWNDRLPNLNAALGVAQLEHLDRRLKEKRQLAELYQKKLGGLEGIEIVEETPGSRSNYWLVSLRLTAPDRRQASKQCLSLLKEAHTIGLQLRPVWTLLHHLPMYQAVPRAELSIAEDLEFRIINLPSSPKLVRRHLR